MHSRISVNTLCLPPALLAGQIEAIAQLGAAGITPDLGQLIEAGIEGAIRHLRDSGMAVAGLTHRAFGFASPQETADARARLFATIDIAARLDATCVIMTTGGRGTLGWSEAADRFAEAMAPCSEQARAAGVMLGIETTSHLYADVSITHRLADAVTLAGMAGIAPIPDLFACWVDADIDVALTQAAPVTPMVQVSDYVLGDRGLPCRAVPGDGAIPWQRIAAQLTGAGFCGWFDLEIIGPRLLAEGAASGINRAAAHIGNLLDRATRANEST